MIRGTLVSEGSTDKRLIPILIWIAKQMGADAEIERADFFGLRARPAGLADRIRQAVSLFPCDILFVHRDSDGRPVAERQTEIADGIRDALVATPYIPVIPVRMQETWLLFNEGAIRQAAGYPKGRTPLGLPAVGRLEALASPKETLRDALRTASGLNGRKLKKFDANQAAYRLSELLDDYAPLRVLPGFADLESRVRAALAP